MKNEGTSTQENVEIWIPIKTISSLDIVKNKDGSTEFVEKDAKVIFETSVPAREIEKHEDKRVLKFSSLRPSESIIISGFAYDGSIFLSKYQFEDLRVVSNSVVGKNNKQNDFIIFLYKGCAFVLLILTVSGIIYGIYYENFMPLEKKEKYLLDQIDKLSKTK